MSRERRIGETSEERLAYQVVHQQNRRLTIERNTLQEALNQANNNLRLLTNEKDEKEENANNENDELKRIINDVHNKILIQFDKKEEEGTIVQQININLDEITNERDTQNVFNIYINRMLITQLNIHETEEELFMNTLDKIDKNLNKLINENNELGRENQGLLEENENNNGIPYLNPFDEEDQELEFEGRTGTLIEQHTLELEQQRNQYIDEIEGLYARIREYEIRDDEKDITIGNLRLQLRELEQNIINTTQILLTDTNQAQEEIDEYIFNITVQQEFENILGLDPDLFT